MQRTRTIAPIIAVLLLLAPILYVLSYLLLVVPKGRIVIGKVTIHGAFGAYEHYRFGAHRIKLLYWPLEQLDRKLRPREWERMFIEDQIEF
jgi:hypothetical protein